jgi:hypothetical protein
MSGTCTIIIGAAQHLEALKQRAGNDTEVLTFSDDHALAALAAITSRRPQVVTLERLFAVTSRGAALINRVKADPSLAATEIRIVSHDGTYSRVSPRRGQSGGQSVSPKGPVPDSSQAQPTAAPQRRTAVVPSAPGAGATAAPLDNRGTRRDERFRINEGTEVQLDGGLAKLIDLSVRGAQIISQQQLKPQQRVRLILADNLGSVRVNAAVAWTLFQMPDGISQYRAGIEFKDAETKAIEAFCMRHKV